MKMETLRFLRLIAKPGDHWVSFDLKDGFSSLAIATQDREAFAISLDVKPLKFYALPMGWSLKPVRVLEAHGCVYKPPQGPGVVNPFFEGATQL